MSKSARKHASFRGMPPENFLDSRSEMGSSQSESVSAFMPASLIAIP